MSAISSALSVELKRKLLLTVLESRHGDLREENLNRQGKGHFHVSGQGHEALAAFGMLMGPDDFACPYYRDRAFVMGRGVSTRQLALDYMAKAESSSHGRQMPAHFSYPEYHIWSVPTPTASQLLPACGMAWGMKMDGKQSLTIATVGDAATRQGDFYEAVSFAKERELPLLMIVEDNGYGISSPTRRTNPMALNVITTERWHFVDGWDVEKVYQLADELMEKIRSGEGPAFIWVKMERLSSHTSTDDQKVYRPKEELSTLGERDPLRVLAAQLADEGVVSKDEFERLNEEIKEKVRSEYTAAEFAANPDACELEVNVLSVPSKNDGELFKPGKYRMGDLINETLRAGLKADHRRVIFGEDVEDPKGGVFTLTKTLSTDFGAQVFNSPLAESTILGVACGLASYGWRPVFEIQFIDFIYPGWNQLVTNLSTLRWRSNGKWSCPTVLYAPYGAYLPGGSLWHSQANESAIAHFPGLNVVVPCTPEDAAGLLWTAMHTDDPTLVLIPKHMLWAERDVKQPISAVPIGHARRCAEGSDVTVVAWGNTVEKSIEAMEILGDKVSIELIDLRSIVPWDHEMIEESVRKTGRIIIVQEDTENCSVGQMIVSHLTGRPDVWSRLVSPPILVSKGNVMIGYSPIYEYAALPDTARIVEAMHRVMKGTLPHKTAIAVEGKGPAPLDDGLPGPDLTASASREVSIKVPVMGEGIRSARIASLMKKPGDWVALDEALCEVETDKAVYPIESSMAGVFKEWRCAVDEEVDIGREIAIMTVDSSQRASVAASPRRDGDEAIRVPLTTTARTAETSISPALSPAITRRLSGVIPVNVQIDVPWKSIRLAREAAKKAELPYTPSLMIAWCTTRAMEKHAAFRRLVTTDASIVERAVFDLGVAVSLEGDRLATAAIHNANRLDWLGFAAAYAKALADTREGKLEEVQAPINITSLGAFGIEVAAPIVVPPAVGTLFVGTAHERMVNHSGCVYPVEVVTLSLTFDHKVVNGAGAAAFLHGLKGEIESFHLPALAIVGA